MIHHMHQPSSSSHPIWTRADQLQETPPSTQAETPPPLHEQISYANVLAERSGETLPDSAIESAAAATAYIQVKKKKVSLSSQALLYDPHVTLRIYIYVYIYIYIYICEV